MSIFKIEIEKTTLQRNVPRSSEWKPTGRKNENDDDIYALTPQITEDKEVTTPVLRTTVTVLNTKDDIFLKAIVKTIFEIGKGE